MASLSEVISPVSDNPTGDRANMVNNTPIIVAGETSIKSPPTFTGSGFSDMEDPLKFLEDFKEAAIWNNWVLDSRKKELFYRCLKGHAKDWYVGEIMEMPNYSGLAFDAPRNESSVVSRFKKKFVTPRWYLKYEERFDERVQGVNEPVSQYVCAKRALYHKANYNKGLDKTEKQLVQDVRKGLLPVLKKACWDWENSPYSPERRKILDNWNDLEPILEWAETSFVKHVSNQGSTDAMSFTPTGSAGTKQIVAVNAVKESKPKEPFEQVVLEQLHQINVRYLVLII